jgi:GT2 family glycosyltransferase
MNEDVTVIIIGHKSKNLILNYIKPIHEKFRIIIIDNSNDFDLTNLIRINYPNILIKNVENDGYGAAINYGSKLVKTKYFLISNPDLTGINEDNLNKFIQVAKKLNDKFSTLGPRYEHANPKTLIQSNEKIEVSEFKVISGACMFFNKKNFDTIGGFDENFFMYFEENDFCLRSFKIYKNYQINSIKVYHNAGNSVSYDNIEEKELHEHFRTWHFMWSKFYFFKKRYTLLIAFLIFLPIIFRLIIRITFHTFFGNKKQLKKYRSRWSGLFNSIVGNKSKLRVN